MLPTGTMLTNQKCVAVGRLLPLALLVFLAACTPPGPRALLDGERLIKEGQFTEAIGALTEATLQLPRNAQAWNHLGLANHNEGRANDALRAYRKALDVDVNLAAARFNLGCLLLDLKQPAFAATEFAAFTVLQPKVGDGWLKRVRAEMLSNQFDAAEKSCKSALALNPKQPEVWNTLGIVQLYRNRVADSFLAFNSGVQQQANYAPALFNAALVSHFYLPRKPVDQRPFALDKYKAFLALKPEVDNLDAIQRVVASLEAELAPKLPAPKPVPAPATNPPPAVVLTPKPELPPTETVAVPKKPEPAPAKPVVIASLEKGEAPVVVAPKPPPLPVPMAVPKSAVVKSPAPASPRIVDTLAPGWTGPNYAYLTPAPPTPGVRADAQTHFAQGLAMQRIGKDGDALAAYQRAIRADGAFFEAYHNLGIAAAQMGDLLKSTAAYETALALESSSASTRFHFAIALQSGGYLRDAAVELERLLVQTPNDASAHFALANLHSQSFKQPAKARAHYLRVLELSPQHPQGTDIRFWLRENP